ncbi:unnamed protein product, partial [Prorocentrum cordatum]
APPSRCSTSSSSSSAHSTAQPQPQPRRGTSWHLVLLPSTYRDPRVTREHVA